MGKPGSDRFLNCVLRRSDKDTVMLIVVLILVIVGTPCQTIYRYYELYTIVGGLPDVDDVYTLALFMGATTLFVIYRMISALVSHHARDVEWMSALIEYAGSEGKDVSEMESLRAKMEATVEAKHGRYALCVFIVMAALILLATIKYSVSETISLEQDMIVEFFLITVVQILLCVANLYVYDRMIKTDRIQCEFTERFSDCMSDGWPVIGPMTTNIRAHSILPHMILMIITLGIYAIPFTLWTVHTLNIHINRQWGYEEDVVKWMMTRDGASSIKAVKKDEPSSRFDAVKRLF